MGTTSKMIEYARVIANFLNLDEPNYNDYNETHTFINNYKEIYRSKLISDCIISDYYEQEEKIKKIGKKFSPHFFNTITSNLLNNKSGIYAFWIDDEIVYIGKSKNLKERLWASYLERSTEAPINKYTVLVIPTMSDVHILEPLLICYYKPKLNIEFKCDDFPTIFELNEKIKLEKMKKECIYEEG